MEIIHPITKTKYPLWSPQAKQLLKQFIIAYQTVGGAKPVMEILKNISLFKNSTREMYLNPVYGFLWTKTNIIKNMFYVFQHSHLSKLVRKLFHQQFNEFRPSKKFFHFSPKDLGKYLGYMYYIQPTILNFEREIKEHEKLKKQIKSMKHTKNKKRLQELTTKRDRQTDRIESHKKFIQNTQDLKKPFKKSIHRYWDKSQYRNLLFFHSVLAIIWWIANDKNGIKEYYHGLNEVLSLIGEPPIDIPPNFEEDVFIDEDYEYPDVSNYYLVLTIIFREILPLQNFETAVLSGRICVPKTNYPDCGETSLRNFVQIISHRKKIFDIEMLQRLGANPDIVSFFSVFNTVALQTSGTKSITIKGIYFDKINVRDAWGFLICDLPNVNYRKNCQDKDHKTVEFEINSGLNDLEECNMLAIIKNLFSNINDWEDFNDIIKPLRLDIRLDEEGLGTIQIFDQKIHKYTWSFREGHFDLKSHKNPAEHRINVEHFNPYQRLFININNPDLSISRGPHNFYHFDYSNEQLVTNIFKEYYYSFFISNDDYESMVKHIYKMFNQSIIKTIDINIFKLGDNLSKLRFFKIFLKFDDSGEFKLNNVVEIDITDNKFQLINLRKLEKLFHLKITQFGSERGVTIENVIRNITHLTFRKKFNLPINSLKGLVNLTHLTFNNDFNQSIDSLSELLNLTHITFGEKFDQPIDILMGMVHLTHVTFGEKFNQPIDCLEILNNITHLTICKIYYNLEKLVNLTHLTLGTEFNQPIYILPINLTHLTFGWNFNKSIDVLKRSVNLTHLTFGATFNQYTDSLERLVNLTHLTFGWNFNKDVYSLKELVNLTHLTFEGEFDQSVDDLPVGLTHLTFGVEFDQSIDNLPVGLTHLTFGVGFNRSIDSLARMIHITHLTFGTEFNKPIDSLSGLVSLTHLTFRMEFNQPIDNLPVSLTHLTLGNGFVQSIESLARLINLTHLTFGFFLEQHIDCLSGLVNLTHLTFGTKFNQSIDNLPINLTNIKFGGYFNRSIDNLEKMVHLTNLTFGCNFNQSIDSLEKLVNLTNLTFGRDFNQSIDSLTELVNLTDLTFGRDFNQSIDSLTGLINLTNLTFKNSNVPIDIDILDHLENLNVRRF